MKSIFAGTLLIAIPFAGWITHIVICLQNEKYVLLVAGALAAPIGIIHGIGHWFGWW